MTLSDFHADLAFSQKASLETFWEQAYRKAFPNYKRRQIVTTEIEHGLAWQRMGVDSLIYLTNGRILTIDEKARRKVYSDVALEYLSNDQTGAPGWMEKDLAMDFLAYAFLPQRRVYLFSWPMLRRAWLEFRETWLASYPRKSSPNPGYKTWSVCVPISVLQKSISRATIIQL